MSTLAWAIAFNGEIDPLFIYRTETEARRAAEAAGTRTPYEIVPVQLLQLPAIGKSPADVDPLAVTILNGLLASWCSDPHERERRYERDLVQQAFRLARLMREEATP